MGKGLDLFLKLVMRQPFPAEKPSMAQMTALIEILRCGGCYVDFTLWGNYHISTAKTFRCRGLVVGLGGVLIDQELKRTSRFRTLAAMLGCLPMWHDLGRRLHPSAPYRLR